MLLHFGSQNLMVVMNTVIKNAFCWDCGLWKSDTRGCSRFVKPTVEASRCLQLELYVQNVGVHADVKGLAVQSCHTTSFHKTYLWLTLCPGLYVRERSEVKLLSYKLLCEKRVNRWWLFQELVRSFIFSYLIPLNMNKTCWVDKEWVL